MISRDSTYLSMKTQRVKTFFFLEKGNRMFYIINYTNYLENKEITYYIFFILSLVGLSAIVLVLHINNVTKWREVSAFFCCFTGQDTQNCKLAATSV